MEQFDIKDIPQEIDGVRLKTEDRNRLANGLETDGVYSSDKGRSGQFKARQTEEGLKFDFIEVSDKKQKVPRLLGGVKLSRSQRKKIKRGEPIFINNMQTKKGLLSGVVMYDKKTRRTTIRPATGIKVPEKEICGVLLTPEQKKSLAEGKPTKIDGMKTRKGRFNGVISLDEEKGVVFHRWERQSTLERAFKLLVDLNKQFKEKSRDKKEDIASGKEKTPEGQRLLENKEYSLATRIKGDLKTGVSLDNEEGEYVVPETLGGVKLTQEQRQSLEKGEPTKIDGVKTEQGSFNVVISFSHKKGITLHDHKKLELVNSKNQGRIKELDDALAKADKNIETIKKLLGVATLKKDTPALPPNTKTKPLPSFPSGPRISI